MNPDNTSSIAINDIVGDSSTGPAAQSRTIAQGLNKMGQLLRLGARAMDENAELRTELEKVQDPYVDVTCPFCTGTSRERQSKAAEAVAEMARRCTGTVNPRATIDGLRAKHQQLQSEVARLTGEVSRLNSQLVVAQGAAQTAVKEFHGRLVAHMENGLNFARGPEDQSEFCKGWDNGFEAAIGHVRSFENVRPNEALVQAPPPAPTPATVQSPDEKFAVGDQVRCSQPGDSLTSGNTYRVLGYERVADQTLVRVNNDKGRPELFCQWRFEPVSTGLTTTPSVLEEVPF